MMRYKIKPSDELRNTTTTMTDDSDLTVALDAGTTYFIDAMVQGCSNATAQFKYSFVYTGTITSAATYEGTMNAAAPSTGGAGDSLGPAYNFGAGLNFTTPSVRANTGSGASGGVGTAGTSEGGHIRGFITTNSSGNLKVQWAQNVSNGGDTSVLKGSYIGIAKVPDELPGTLIIKGGDTSRTNNTLTADPDLQFTTDANKKYIVEMLAIGDAGSTTPDFKMALHDANVSISCGAIINADITASGTFSGASDTRIHGHWKVNTFVTTPTTGVANTQNSTNKSASHVLCSHVMTGSAGTLAFEWAQNTTNATATIVRASSWMLYQEIIQP